MDYYKPTFQSFMKELLSSRLDQQKDSARERARGLPEDVVLNQRTATLAEEIAPGFQVPRLELHLEAVDSRVEEVEVPAADHAFSYAVTPGKTYRRDFIVVRIPFTGDPALLRCRPNSFLSWSPRIFLEGSRICLGFVDFNLSGDEVKKRVDGEIGNLSQWAELANDDVDKHNDELEPFIQSCIEARKAELKERKSKLAVAGLPEQVGSGNVAKTFAIAPPKIRKLIVFDKTGDGEALDPTLDEESYYEILTVLARAGGKMEQHPSTYKDKSEEEIRDLFLTILDPGVDGHASGETYNRSGKTDILIQHDGRNVFVAECKVWRGAGGYADAIDQLLSYLTWRDSKTALLVFVPNKGFSAVLQAIKEATPEHPRYLRHVEDHSEGWTEYRFHLPDDEDREVFLNVICFHFPSTD